MEVIPKKLNVRTVNLNEFSELVTIFSCSLKVDSMTCSSCTSTVEKVLKGAGGAFQSSRYSVTVKSASVDLLSARANVIFTLTDKNDTGAGAGAGVGTTETLDKSDITSTANNFGKLLADEVDSIGFGAELVSVKTEIKNGESTEVTSRSKNNDKTIPTTCIFEFSRKSVISATAQNGGAVQLNRIGGIMSRLINEMSSRESIDGTSAALTRERDILQSHLVQQKGVISCAVTNVGEKGGKSKKSKKKEKTKERELFTNEFPHRVSLILDPDVLHVRRIADYGKDVGFNECRLVSAYSSSYKIDNVASNGESNMDAMQSNLATEQHDYFLLLIVSALFSIPVSIISMGIPQDKFGSAGEVPGIPGLWIRDLILVFLTAPVQFGVGWRFYKKSFAGIRGVFDCFFKSGSRRRVVSMGMDFLIAAGTTAAYFASILEMAVAVAEQKAMDSMVDSITPDPSIPSDDHSGGHSSMGMPSPSPSPSSYYNMPSSAHGAMKPMVFFDTSALLITFVILGKFLESAAKKQTGGALAALLDLQPATALVCVEKTSSTNLAKVEDEEKWVKRSKSLSGSEENDTEQFDSRRQSQDEMIHLTIEENEDGGMSANDNHPATVSVAFTRSVPLSLVVPGDLVKVYPGASIPCDGIVEAGLSEVNESMVSGESLPVLKGVGDEVTGATVNSVTGVLLIRVSRVGSNSVLSQIVELVEQAQMQKAPIQAFADKISSFFAPFVIVLALITLFIWLGVALTGHLPPNSIPSGGSPFTFSLLFSISVVVVACPCALGLATPTAVMVGTGVAARLMVLFKGGSALEATAGVNTIVFDKTGTLTLGKPSLTDLMIISVPNTDETKSSNVNPVLIKEHLSAPQILGALRAAESCSEHPLAKAIFEGTDEAAAALLLPKKASSDSTNSDVSIDLPLYNVPTESFVSAPGKGILCKVIADAKSFFASSSIGTGIGAQAQLLTETVTLSVIVGNRSWIVENLDQNTSSSLLLQTEESMKALEAQGKTAVMAYISASSEQFAPVAVLLGIADRVRPEARSVLHALRTQLKIKVKMVTGDTARTAAAIAMLLNFPSEDVVADCLPQRKAEIVKQLQEEGGNVAVVGDGINDAPALAAANVGIAIGAGSHIAVATSDVVLVRSDLRDVLTALHLSRVIVRRIYLNFVWALGYNILGIPLAAGILWPFTRMKVAPEAAGLAMAFSSVSVVMSSLLLRRYKRPADEDFYNSTSTSSGDLPVGVVLQQPALTSLSQQIASAVEGAVHFKDERKLSRRGGGQKRGVA
jgi:heavy metal translocating P-type ATPase